MENTPENGVWKRKDLIFKWGSWIPHITETPGARLSPCFALSRTVCDSHCAFFVVQARRGTDPSFRATGCVLSASQGGCFVYTAPSGGNGLATPFAPCWCWKPHLKRRNCAFASIFSVLNHMATARQNTGVSLFIKCKHLLQIIPVTLFPISSA